MLFKFLNTLQQQPFSALAFSCYSIHLCTFKSSIIALQLSFIQKERVKRNNTAQRQKKKLLRQIKAVLAQLVLHCLPHQNACTRYLYLCATTILHPCVYLRNIYGFKINMMKLKLISNMSVMYNLNIAITVFIRLNDY